MALSEMLKLVTDGSAQQAAVAMRLSGALGQAFKLAQYLQLFLEEEADYFGPVVVAGGYVRDLATERTPKDLDVFIDGGHAGGPKANLIAAAVCTLLGHGAKARMIPCYGTWAPDVATIIKIEFEDLEDAGQELLYIDGVPIPFSVDIVVLGREQLIKNGYTPDADAEVSFLKACVNRVDTRLNCIGASQTQQLVHSEWIADVLNERIVVQSARAGEDLSRIAARTERLAATKFENWTQWIEWPDGEILPMKTDGPDSVVIQLR